MGDDGKKKKLTMLALSSILLVAAVVGVVVGVKKNNDGGDGGDSGGSSGQVTTSNKAATAICQPTDFKETCEKSLSSANTSDPKELMRVAFQYTVKKIEGAIQNSTVLQEAAKDPRTSHAFDTCKEVLNDSIDDLKRAFDQVGNLDASKTGEYIDDLKTWLSATVTYHETCLDAFENTTGDSGEKMKKLLKTSGELLSNSLAMVSEASKIVDALGLSSFSRRLLEESSHDDYLPYPMRLEDEKTGRRLFNEETSGEGDDYLPYPMKLENEKTGRRLFREKEETSHDDYVPYPMKLEEEKTGRRLFREKEETSHDDYVPYPMKLEDEKTGRRLFREKEETSHDDYVPYPMKLEDEKTGRRLFQEESSHDDYLPYPMKLEDEKTRRRLFQEESSHDDYLPYPMKLENEKTGRRLFQEESSHDDYVPYPMKLEEGKTGRRLFQEERSHDDYMPYPIKYEAKKEEYPTWIDSGRRALLSTDPKTIKPNVVVAKDGSGTAKTIMEAINAAPKKSNGTFVILIKQGVYNEYVEVPRHTNGIVFIGEGATKTKITGNKNYIDGIGTYKTATVAVNGERFMARDIGFENSAGPMKHQAVALRVSGDRAIFYNCNMDGYQDTLYTHSYRQFYRECNVTGTIDFIFGDAAVVLQKCNLIVRKPLSNQACMVTAQGRKDQRSIGGIVLQGCKITATPEFMNADPRPESYLGRPWKEYSRTIIMQSYIDSNIVPEGWSPWAGNFGLDTCYYGEFNNRGPSSSLANRVTWKGYKKISPQEADSFTPGKYIQGDMWIKPTRIPYDFGMMKV